MSCCVARNSVTAACRHVAMSRCVTRHNSYGYLTVTDIEELEEEEDKMIMLLTVARISVGRRPR